MPARKRTVHHLRTSPRTKKAPSTPATPERHASPSSVDSSPEKAVTHAAPAPPAVEQKPSPAVAPPVKHETERSRDLSKNDGNSDSESRRVIRPLIRTTYNTDWINRLAVAGVAILLVLLGFGMWQQWPLIQQLTHQPVVTKPPQRLQVASQSANLERLSSIPGAMQASTPAQATAEPNLRPAALDPAETSKSTTELFVDLRSSIDSLHQQHISTNQSVETYLAQATAAEQHHDDAATRQDLLDGLQLAREMQILHDYYKK